MAVNKHEVVVVGAGPVGSYVATLLAERGVDVLAVDRKPAPGANVCCTGIVGTAYLDLLDVPGSLVYYRPRGAVLVSPADRPLKVAHAVPVAAVLDRAGLERTLVSRGRQAGATFQFQTTVGRIVVTPEGVRLRVTREGETTTLTARSVVIASGHGPPPGYPLPRITEAWVGAQVEVALHGPGPIRVFSDQAIAPGGFAWLVPTSRGRGLAGLVTRRLHDRRLTRLITKLRQQGLVRDILGETGVRTLPLRGMARTVGDRVLVVGAAAGQVKPTTGGGLYYGALCARMAADVLSHALSCDSLSASNLDVYERLWRARLGRELALGYLAHTLLDKMHDAHLERLFSLAKRKQIPAWVRSLPPSSFDWHGRRFLEMIARLAVPESPGRARLATDPGVECPVP